LRQIQDIHFLPFGQKKIRLVSPSGPNPNGPNIKGRADLIKPEHVDNVYLVHTGKEYKEIKISSSKVGMKFGEFAATKIPAK